MCQRVSGVGGVAQEDASLLTRNNDLVSFLQRLDAAKVFIDIPCWFVIPLRARRTRGAEGELEVSLYVGRGGGVHLRAHNI